MSDRIGAGVAVDRVRDEFGDVLVGGGSVDRVSDRQHGLAGRQFDRLFEQQRFLAVDDLLHPQPTADGRVSVAVLGCLRCVRLHDHAGFERRALTDLRRQIDLFDQHLRGGVDRDRDDIDADARVGQSRRGPSGAAEILVAVGDDDDPPSGPLGHRRQCQIEGVFQVGRVASIDALQTPDGRDVVVQRRNLDRGVASEHDHAGLIVAFDVAVSSNVAADVFEHRVAAFGRDAVRLIQHVHDGCPVVGTDDPDAGEGEDDRGPNRRPQQRRQDPTAGTEHGERPPTDDRQRHQTDQQPEINGTLEPERGQDGDDHPAIVPTCRGRHMERPLRFSLAEPRSPSSDPPRSVLYSERSSAVGASSAGVWNLPGGMGGKLTHA